MASTSLTVFNGTESITNSVPSCSGSVKSDDVDGSESFNEKNNSFGSRNQTDSLEDMNCNENENSGGQNRCNICTEKITSPRILSCLHVFCEACIDDLSKKQMDTNFGTGISVIITCTMCQQKTSLDPRGASALCCDYVLINILDTIAIKNTAILCTSCKSMNNAVSRCSDCANFLCPNCNTAHEFMRCFENHKVITFEDLKKSDEVVPIHQPIFCNLHTGENMKFFCHSCQVFNEKQSVLNGKLVF